MLPVFLLFEDNDHDDDEKEEEDVAIPPVSVVLMVRAQLRGENVPIGFKEKGHRLRRGQIKLKETNVRVCVWEL